MAQAAPIPDLNDRWRSVPMTARALAFEINSAAGRLHLDLGGLTCTPHGRKDAKVQIAKLRTLLRELEGEI